MKPSSSDRDLYKEYYRLRERVLSNINIILKKTQK